MKIWSQIKSFIIDMKDIVECNRNIIEIEIVMVIVMIVCNSNSNGYNNIMVIYLSCKLVVLYLILQDFLS